MIEWPVFKETQTLMVFWEEFFIGKIWGEDCRVDGFLLMG